MAIFAQVPPVLVAAVSFMRVVSPRLAVMVAYCDGLLMGGGVLLIGMTTDYDSFLSGRTSVLVSAFTLAQPVTDVVVLTLMVAVVARVGRNTRPIGLLIGAAIVCIGIPDAELARHVGLGVAVPGSVFAKGSPSGRPPRSCHSAPMRWWSTSACPTEVAGASSRPSATDAPKPVAVAG